MARTPRSGKGQPFRGPLSSGCLISCQAVSNGQGNKDRQADRSTVSAGAGSDGSVNLASASRFTLLKEILWIQ